MDPLEILRQHGTYLSEEDDRDIDAVFVAAGDNADLARRTCLCGVRLDGFDEYHEHLRRVFSEASGGGAAGGGS